MKAIVTGHFGPVLHAYPTGARVTVLKQCKNKTDFWCRDQYGLKQWVCGIDLDLRFRIILNPVGLIASRAAITAYLAHEAKKALCPVCGLRCTLEIPQP